jgi:hypothetical protein
MVCDAIANGSELVLDPWVIWNKCVQVHFDSTKEQLKLKVCRCGARGKGAAGRKPEASREK